VESDTLCRDIANAYYAFLSGAVQTDDFCRSIATTRTMEVLSGSDGGLDGGAFCSQAYAQCLRTEPPVFRFMCPIPFPSYLPQQCDATVEDVSACLNEIAAHDPVGTCAKSPGCDGAPSARGGAPSLSATPACDVVRHGATPGWLEAALAEHGE